MRVVHSVLQEMQRHTEGCETEFFIQAKLTEAEEINVNVLGKVAADKLFATIVKRADAVGPSTTVKRGTLMVLN